MGTIGVVTEMIEEAMLIVVMEEDVARIEGIGSIGSHQRTRYIEHYPRFSEFGQP